MNERYKGMRRESDGETMFGAMLWVLIAAMLFAIGYMWWPQ